MAEGGAYVNNRKVTDAEAVIEAAELLHGRYLLVRRGKKQLGSRWLRVPDRRTCRAPDRVDTAKGGRIGTPGRPPLRFPALHGGSAFGRVLHRDDPRRACRGSSTAAGTIAWKWGPGRTPGCTPICRRPVRRYVSSRGTGRPETAGPEGGESTQNMVLSGWVACRARVRRGVVDRFGRGGSP